MAEKENISMQTPPEEIEADIARTRQEISGTVNAIQEKLSPKRLKEQVREEIRSRVQEARSRISRRARDMSSAASDFVRNNPIPLAIIGIEIASVFWLQATRRRRTRSASAIRRATQELAGKSKEFLTPVQETIAQLPGKAKKISTQAQEAGVAKWLGIFSAALVAGTVLVAIPNIRKERAL